MSMPFFSIIIPTLNSAKTLPLALESILQQNFADFEILIMDGVSTDNTIEIAHSFCDERIKIVSEKDDGIYDAMNKGIKLVSGEWLYFLGSDDRFYNENVLGTITKFILVHNPKIVYGNVLIEGDSGWAKSGQIYDGEFTLPKLIEKNICHQSIFFNKIVFKSCGEFNLRYNICADWDMNLKTWASFRFHFIDTTIAVFKGGNSSKLIKNNYADVDKWLNILNSFRIRIISRELAQFYENFLMLSNYFRQKGEYFKSFLLLCTYYLQQGRIK